MCVCIYVFCALKLPCVTIECFPLLYGFLFPSWTGRWNRILNKIVQNVLYMIKNIIIIESIVVDTILEEKLRQICI